MTPSENTSETKPLPVPATTSQRTEPDPAAGPQPPWALNGGKDYLRWWKKAYPEKAAASYAIDKARRAAKREAKREERRRINGNDYRGPKWMLDPVKRREYMEHRKAVQKGFKKSYGSGRSHYRAMKERARSLADAVIDGAAIKRILEDPNHPQFMRAVEFVSERGYGKVPQETKLEVKAPPVIQLPPKDDVLNLDEVPEEVQKLLPGEVDA